MTRDRIERLDRDDPLAAKRAEFHVPEGLIYLDGNSLGLLPRRVQGRLARVVDHEWGERLIRSWNEAGWIDLAGRAGDKIGRLIGAPAGTVMVADSTSLNLFKALSAALSLRPDRRVILSDTGNFPNDLYVAQGLAKGLDRGHELELVPPEEVSAHIGSDVAVLMLTQVDYRTGRLHDMKRLTREAHAAGALTIWDLAHSAGALPVDVTGAGADFAVGCGYKYLNGGPGAPAFVYVAPRHADGFAPFLAGWLGHAAPFAFELEHRPAPGIAKMTVGTPPILSLAALDTALDVFDGIDMRLVREKSVALCELFIAEIERRCEGQGLRLASPRDAALRGSQVSFRHEHGYEIMQTLIGESVIGDFRAPDIMRFGIAPLYLRYRDVADAAAILADILKNETWRKHAGRPRAAVT